MGPYRQLVSLILLSGHCEQYIRYDCKEAPLNSGNESNAWWTDRHEEQHFYWSGSSRVEEVMGFQGVCYCHAQGSCVTPEALCNCDAGESAWSYDDGQLTDRNQLPVTKLNFGHLDKEDRRPGSNLALSSAAVKRRRRKAGKPTRALLSGGPETLRRATGWSGATRTPFLRWCTVTAINYLAVQDSNVSMEALAT